MQKWKVFSTVKYQFMCVKNVEYTSYMERKKLCRLSLMHEMFYHYSVMQLLQYYLWQGIVISQKGNHAVTCIVEHGLI